MDTLHPFLSNCALACELLLKAILCFERTDYIMKLYGKDRHSLYRLYGLLKPETQKELANRFPYRDDVVENFELCLQENAQAFLELRYATEYKRLSGSVYFIPDLMVTLYNIAASRNIERN